LPETGWKHFLSTSFLEGCCYGTVYHHIITKPTVPILPVTGCKDVLSTSFPEGYCYGTVYHHIITKAKEQKGEWRLDRFQHFKPLIKRRQYFRSGHVNI
jgi:hypothetical protein